MNKPIFEVGKTYPRRDGVMMKILENDAPGDYSVVARTVKLIACFNDTQSVQTQTFTHGGKICVGADDAHDLIPPKRRVPWNKLTDVELGHEYSHLGNSADYIEGIISAFGLCLRTGKMTCFDKVSNLKHRAPGTTEWLECDKEES